jgi:putative Mg2+ transporter-C (MgtC) family protein
MLPDGFDWATLAARMGIAILAGAVVGWDRQRTGKSAGMRTHMLVSLGSCLFVLATMGGSHGPDSLSHAIQGVATGVGFLGGGVILHRMRHDEHGASVRGMTSAAAIWVTAALGVASGVGLWRLVALAIAAGLLVLALLKPLERALFSKPDDDDQP